jgi:hypothetical protein
MTSERRPTSRAASSFSWLLTAALVLGLAPAACSDKDSPAADASAGSGGAGGSGRTGGSGGAGTGGAAGTGGTGTGGAGGSGATGGAGGNGGPPAAPERFAGKWQYTSGQARLECPGMQALAEDLTGASLTFQIGAGVSPLILESPGCNLRFDIQGQTAVVQPGQSCMNAIAGRAAKSVPTVFTFALKEQVAEQNSVWTVTFTATPNTPCTLTGLGILAKP